MTPSSRLTDAQIAALKANAKLAILMDAPNLAAVSPEILLALVGEVEQQRASCEWRNDDDGIWHTACGHAFEFNTDGPTENQQAFCGYCGKHLVPLPAAPEEPR